MWKKGYCDWELFVLNIYEIIKNAYSFAYLIDSYDIWHVRLWHINYLYVFKLKRLGMISLSGKIHNNCDICIADKLTKKTCPRV